MEDASETDAPRTLISKIVKSASKAKEIGRQIHDLFAANSRSAIVAMMKAHVMSNDDGETSNFYEMIVVTHSENLFKHYSEHGVTKSALRRKSTDFRYHVLQSYVYCWLTDVKGTVAPRKRKREAAASASGPAHVPAAAPSSKR